EDHFTITVASEVMAVFCLASDIRDLKRRLGRMIVAYDLDGKPVTAEDIKATGAMTALLKDAIKPNMIQTLEHTPVLVHGGPFANIAHGCNSVIATKTALKLADIVITEAGFGADLGAEKFFDIKCRKAGLTPSAVVLVATVRALKYNGGIPREKLDSPDIEALKKGMANLGRHIDNLKSYGLPVIVALNAFVSDTEEEIACIEQYARDRGCEFSYSRAWEKGGEGAIDLAEKINDILSSDTSGFKYLYPDDMPVKEKIETIATRIYGASGVEFSTRALKELKEIEESGAGGFPVCMAKTQYSFSDDPALLGAPENFTVRVREVYLSGGAGFVVALTGDIMTMPGLSKHPAAYDIDVDDNGRIRGLF
ncbi:MAG: formate--tetrahydrofolate ligase, partial [Lachnospiraceae bacterium]|nr:formate--tetrahydrofolate ligase [Lachnospiraceae bacterium]